MKLHGVLPSSNNPEQISQSTGSSGKNPSKRFAVYVFYIFLVLILVLAIRSWRYSQSPTENNVPTIAVSPTTESADDQLGDSIEDEVIQKVKSRFPELKDIQQTSTDFTSRIAGRRTKTGWKSKFVRGWGTCINTFDGGCDHEQTYYVKVANDGTVSMVGQFDYVFNKDTQTAERTGTFLPQFLHTD